MLKKEKNDLRKMKLIKWAEQYVDRLKWKDIVERAKTVLEEEKEEKEEEEEEEEKKEEEEEEEKK